MPNSTPTPNWRVLAIRPESLLNMLVHYTEDRDSDRIPNDAELRDFQQNRVLRDVFKLTVRSAKWECPSQSDGSLAPLDFRYQGTKVATLGQKGNELTRSQARDTPRRR